MQSSVVDTEGVKRILASIGNNWGELSDLGREEVMGLLISDIKKLAAQNSKRKSCRMMYLQIFDLIRKTMSDFCENQRENCLICFAGTGFFKSFNRCFKGARLELYCIDDQRIVGLFKLFPKKRVRERALVGCHLYECMTTGLQDFVRSQVISVRNELDYTNIVDAVFCGGLRYDRRIYDALFDRIEDSDKRTLERNDVSNPVYVLAWLYFWQYIDRYELNRFEPLLETSDMLRLLIRPEEFEWEELRPEWGFILKQPEYEKFYKKHMVEKLYENF